ncbi:hypothetical protein ACI4BE_28070, partial [Klebsiella pneumoniae]|uniref:hypothetical protein n=1 Tax=Klebsiella pneumoniae TaxID=573 RepID=UPI003853414A
MRAAGEAHLAIRYGIRDASGATRASSLEEGWPAALSRSLVDSKLARRESYLGSSSRALKL